MPAFIEQIQKNIGSITFSGLTLKRRGRHGRDRAFGAEEIRAVTDVIERKMIHRYGSHSVRKGIYRVEEFENKAKEITGSRHALAVANGTAALIVALKGLGVGPGKEVITSPFTFIATVEAIVACGAVPVLGVIDSTLGLDPRSAEKLITEKTGALMPVHMFRASADMDAFMEISRISAYLS